MPNKLTKPVGSMRADPAMITPPMSRRGTEDINASASPSLKPGIPIRKHLPSYHGMYIDEDYGRDSRAVTTYDSRQQLFINEDEETAKQRNQYPSVTEYPQPTPHRHTPDAIRTYPPVSQSWIDTAGPAPIQSVSTANLELLLKAGLMEVAQSGHKYGKLHLNGKGSALRGNTYTDPSFAVLGGKHEYGDAFAGDKWTGALLDGNHHVSAVKEAFDEARRSAHMPPADVYRSAPYDDEPEDFS